MGIQRVMVIDLDAHQGNGHELDHKDNRNVFTIDCYNHGIFPGDDIAKQGIESDLRVNYTTSDSEFL